MSEDFKRLEVDITRMRGRMERLEKIRAQFNAEVDAILAEGHTDIQAKKLHLDALRYEGDSAETPKRRKDDK